MKSDDLIVELIKNFAEKRPEISYVIQNGSRVNPNVVPDQYADYDIIYGCREYEKYVANLDWIDYFGELLILQQNELERDDMRWPIFLMQFRDGLRIDLQFYPGDGVEIYHSDSLSRILVDKHNLFQESFEASEAAYITRKPTVEEYHRALNEFWWCLINVGKGLARQELTYSRFMYESIVREAFLQLVSWYVSSQHGWAINTGKFGKFLERYTDRHTWKEIEATYDTDSDEAFWESLFHAGWLIQRIDKDLRKELAISSPGENADAILAFLETIRNDVV